MGTGASRNSTTGRIGARIVLISSRIGEANLLMTSPALIEISVNVTVGTSPKLLSDDEVLA